MNLTEYQSICKEAEGICYHIKKDMIRQDEALNRIGTLTEYLRAERKQEGKNLAESCKKQVKARNADSLLRYYIKEWREDTKSNINYYIGQIGTFKDELESGEEINGGEYRRALIRAVKDLYSHCLYLSRICSESLITITTVEQLIRKMGNEKALLLAEDLRKAGFLDDDYYYTFNTGDNPIRGELNKKNKIIGLLGHALGDACGHKYIAKVEKLWGCPPKSLNRDFEKAQLDDDTPEIIQIKKILEKHRDKSAK